ncbi:MAG: RecX family transcriptional regulator [Chloroflexi bacterium]|nr:RecX family transcriptional regulator [Chloroflexota bacterium]
MAGKISGLEIQQKNKSRVNVFLDGEYAFSLGLMEAAPLRKGQHLSDTDIQQLQEADSLTQAYERAVRFLATRPRSINEVRRKLAEKKTPTTIVETVIGRLEAAGYLNDAEFAQYWVENRQESSPRGPMALRMELREKGVSSGLIDEVLSNQEPEPVALRAAEKKARTLRRTTKRDFRQKMTSFLMRRGFDYETVRNVLDSLIEQLEAETDGDPFFSDLNGDDTIEE